MFYEFAQINTLYIFKLCEKFTLKATVIHPPE